ncbi:MAG: UDP-2,3-diacylglucosamine diphosphatase LpxI [Sneathiella sp.]|nr:UDP-2,3-diacylglucosamine diphosphatase LpxI [Sneathiella sp.]
MASASLDKRDLTSQKIGIIAGQGDLPLKLARSLKSKGVAFHFLLVANEADEIAFADYSYDVIPIAKVGRFLKALKQSNCTAVTLAGPVSRPNFKNLIPDMEGAKLIAKIGGALSKGDDGLLSAVTDYIEGKGFQIIGAHELEGNLTASSGVLGTIQPTASHRQDIEKGAEICREIGRLDIGQAVVIRDGYILAVEAAEGTKNLIRRAGEFAWQEPAGLLVKLPKPGQNLKADMPTVGLETLAQIKAANLSGLVVEAEKTLILDKGAFIKQADELGLFIYAVEPLDND